MEKFHDVIQDRGGNAISTATISIYDTGTTDLAAIFMDDELTPLDNPFTVADSNYASDGHFWFNAANGKYDIFVDNGGGDEKTIDEIELFDIGDDPHTDISGHLADTANPHSVTKAQTGLGSADNTSDADKPISTATQAALNNKSATGHGHSIYILADGSRDFTGSQNTLDLLPVTDGVSSLGSASKRYEKLNSRQINNFYDDGTGSRIITLQSSTKSGVASAALLGAGECQLDLSFNAVACFGSLKANNAGALSKIKATAPGASAFGRAKSNYSGSIAEISANGDGSSASGNTRAIYTTSNSSIKSDSLGSFSAGSCYAYGTGGSAKIINAGTGGFSQGSCYNAYAASLIKVGALASGGFAQGFCSGITYNATIYSGQQGASAQGLVIASSQDSGIYATATGSSAQGRVASGIIRASGNGSSARGNATNAGTIIASGDGSFAQGYIDGAGTISATADNAAQFGVGTNSTPDSLKVGISTLLTSSGSVILREKSAPVTSFADWGQLWIKNTTPCELWFTDDAGTSTQIV